MPDVHEILTRRLDPGWVRGEPSALLPDWGERHGALLAVSPEVAAASAAFVAALAGAADVATAQLVRNAALSRENGAFPEALALVPTLPVERKRACLVAGHRP